MTPEQQDDRQDDLLVAWNAAWDMADEVFDRDTFVNSVISRTTSTHPECQRPTREDMARAVTDLCQLIKLTIAAAEALARCMAEGAEGVQ